MKIKNGPDKNAPPLKLLSVVIPARDESGCVADTVEKLHKELESRQIAHEIIVVDDGSSDDTWPILCLLKDHIPELSPTQNKGPNGFGRAIIWGLNQMKGDAVAIVMADDSDEPEDVVKYWNKLNEGWDCVFGSRFIKGGSVVDYPLPKLILNRCANLFVSILFGLSYNDTTNAFKAYRREVIEGCSPLIAPHFNLTVEIPLKAIVRGYSWTVVPIGWRNRKTGLAKLKIPEMGSRYLFICLYVWLEKTLTSDYRRKR